MPFPLLSEYIEAIKSAEDNFKELTNLRPVLTDDGQPVMTSGNFAVVFKMQDMETGKFYALKCFTREQEGREEAYHQIAEELKDVDSPYLVSFRFLDKELFVDTTQTDETEFPVLLMDWVEGKTLDKYLRENLDDKFALEMLAYHFSQLAQWLIPQPFAHGDLKPDNILVREDGTLLLVDYDGMYVPAMKGQKARELGSPDFRHPLRTENDFDEHIDDFPLVSILLSLRAISYNPLFLRKYGTADRLLFSKMDYLVDGQCDLLSLFQISENRELSTLTWLFKEACKQYYCANIPFYISLNKPRPEYMNLSTEVTKTELGKAWKDAKGVRYSNDKKRLLKGPIIEYINGDYSICAETKVICNHAFSPCWGFEQINIPSGLVRIGDYAFYGCNGLKNINIPNSVMDVGNWAFEGCGITSIVIPDSVKDIGDWAFTGCKNLKTVSLGIGLSELGKGLFSSCYSLETVIVPQGIKYIGKNAFSYCKRLKVIHLPNSIREIGEEPFVGCENLVSIIVPIGSKWKFEYLLPNDKDKLVELKEHDFLCTEVIDERFVDLNMPSSVLSNVANIEVDTINTEYDNDYCRVKEGTKSIREYAFFNHTNIRNVFIPNSVVSIGDGSFWGCESIRRIELQEGITSIGVGAFFECTSLENINLPDSLETIGALAFKHCKFDNVRIPSKLTEIEESTFEGCHFSFVNFPNSLGIIGKRAFAHCDNLREIHFSQSIIRIEKEAFLCCSSLEEIIIPSSVEYIGDYAFAGCPLRHVTFLSPLTKLGTSIPFAWCNTIERIIVPAGSSSRYKQWMPIFKDVIYDASEN